MRYLSVFLLLANCGLADTVMLPRRASGERIVSGRRFADHTGRGG